MSTTLRATCLCGTCEHVVDVPTRNLPLRALACHCNSCRHVTGALYLSVAYLPDSYEPTAALLDKMQTYNFSERLTNYFCPTCGTRMFGRSTSDDGKVAWEISTGSLERADGVFDLQGHMLLGDTLDGGLSEWLLSVSGKPIPRWEGWCNRSEELPPGWRASKRPEVEHLSSDKLHAHCHCGGVNFYVSRASAQSERTTGPWPDVLVPYYTGLTDLPENEPWWLRANKQKFLAGVCGCDSCRLAFGVEFVQWAFVPTMDISLSADGKAPFSRDFGTLKAYRSSKEATRRFCGQCGATVFWDGDARPGLIDVAVGLCSAEEGARAESWFEWHSQRLSYREDAIQRAESLVLGIEEGMRHYGVESQGRSSLREEVLNVQGT